MNSILRVAFAVETLDRFARDGGMSQPSPPTDVGSDVRSFIDDVEEWWKSHKTEVIERTMEKRAARVQELRGEDHPQDVHEN